MLKQMNVVLGKFRTHVKEIRTANLSFPNRYASTARARVIRATNQRLPEAHACLGRSVIRAMPTKTVGSSGTANATKLVLVSPDT
ncbi:hypothetical protein DPMN_127624 [Dreissena polymorpha]|uniref:Uncharacterized protein n=1 Tax=Dreissena polymorpha TaxID=45954 RepID=A0A9D4GZA6_DREPO|nr:hypothetical protein DPMN_127624 [Dreissena polymorpha]